MIDYQLNEDHVFSYFELIEILYQYLFILNMTVNISF
jgi:hypothetical protein